jgi:hypothetical protein
VAHHINVMETAFIGFSDSDALKERCSPRYLELLFGLKVNVEGTRIRLLVSASFLKPAMRIWRRKACLEGLCVDEGKC